MDIQKQLVDLRDRYQHWEKCCAWLGDHPDDPPERDRWVEGEIAALGKQVEAISAACELTCIQLWEYCGAGD